MAFLRSSLGFFSGRLQNNVFKETSSGNVVAATGSYSAPMDPASVSRRTKFQFTVKLAAAIIKLLSIKILWQRTLADKRCLNKVFKSNYPRVNPVTMDLSKILLSVNTDFPVINAEINITPTGIDATVPAIGVIHGITPLETKVCAEGVLCMSAPSETYLPPYLIIPVRSADQNLVLTETLTFNLPIAGSDAIMAQSYTTKSAALSLVTKNAAGEPVKTSVSFAN